MPLASVCIRVLVVALWTVVPPAAAQDLRIHGSNTVGEHLAPALLQAWLRHRAGVEATVRTIAAGESELGAAGVRVQLQAHGSNAGLRDLLAGRSDIAMSSRAASAAEIAQARAANLGQLDGVAQEFVIALDGVAVIVHPDNPVATLDLAQLRGLFAGTLADWARVGGRAGSVRVHARDAQSGTFETFRTLVLGEQSLVARAQRHESTDALAAAVVADPQAIGFVGLGGIGDARAVAVRDGSTAALLPQVDTVAVEDYLLARRLYLYLRADAPALAREFAEFAVGDAAQPVVRRAGFITQAIQAVSARVAPEAPADYAQMTAAAQRLSVNFRFGSGDALLDSRGERDLDRLARHMARHPASGRLVLMSFADASEALPYLAVTLANDRVDAVAAQLIRRGVQVAAARGIGGALPVASNRSDWGRQRNRRVEVWLQPQAGGAAGAGMPP